MANALKALFQDQADAIREGLGNIGKIKPEDFPAKTREIVALIGTGSGSGDEGEAEESTATLRITNGSFRTKSRAYLLPYQRRFFTELTTGGGGYIWECSPAQFVIESGIDYMVRWGSNPEVSLTAYKTNGTTIGNFTGNFVCLGNAGHNPENGKTEFRMVYDAENDRNLIVTYLPILDIECGIYSKAAEHYGKTIEHGLGQIPDFFVVYKSGADTSGDYSGGSTLLYSAYGFSSKFKDSLENLGASLFSMLCFSFQEGIDEAGGALKLYCPDENTVQILGGDDRNGASSSFFPNSQYYWTAVASDLDAEEGGGGSEDIDETAKYNLALAEAMMTRDAGRLGDPKILRLDSFTLSDGTKLGTLNRYSFAGFDQVEKIVLGGGFLIQPYSLKDNKALKLIDVTTFDLVQGLSFRQQSLSGCTALESVIIRDGGGGVNYATFINSDEALEDMETGTGANDTFFVYVPSAYYESIISNVNGLGDNSAVPASRYRRLEDYPEINYWDKDFTVRCWDGDTLIAEKTVKGGQSLSYKPTKEGYKFFGWDLAVESVVSDMDVHAVFVPANMGDATWTEIDMVAQSGRLSEFYSIGDEKDLTITHEDGTTEDVTMVLEAFNNGALIDGTTAKASFLSKHAMNETVRVCSSSNGSYYGGAAINSYLNDTFPNYLPEDLRQIIKKKKTAGDAGTSVADLSYNRSICWLPSSIELGVKKSSSWYDDKTVAFPRYTSNESRIKTVGADGEAVKYWTKTYYTSGTSSNPRYYYYCVSADGTAASAIQGGTSYFNLVFGFCI